jgi:hypothetical protein
VSDLALLMRLQARVTAFLAELSLDRLKALAEGRAKLAVLDAGEGRPAADSPPSVAAIPRSSTTTNRAKSSSSAFDADAVAAQLLACKSVDEGTELLAGLKPKAADLRLLARALNIQPERTMAENTRTILKLTLGSRNKHAVLRQG